LCDETLTLWPPGNVGLLPQRLRRFIAQFGASFQFAHHARNGHVGHRNAWSAATGRDDPILHADDAAQHGGDNDTHNAAWRDGWNADDAARCDGW